MNRFRFRFSSMRPVELALLVTVLMVAELAPANAQAFKTLYNFQGYSVQDGAYPVGLVQGPNGYLYGTTFAGGVSNGGTIFGIAPNGTKYAILLSSGTNQTGIEVGAGLTLAANGNFYGTTEGNASGGNYGTAFKMTPAGAVTVEYQFCSVFQNNICEDGFTPEVAPIQARNGYLYGSTDFGGAYGEGTLYKMTPGGGLTTLHSFCAVRQGQECTDGAQLISPLVQGTDGNLYGTTSTGGTGAYTGGTGSGTFFRITPQGQFTSLYSFCSQPFCTDGDTPPPSGLVVGPNGNLYGVTLYGGSQGFGSFFTVTTTGVVTTLHSFCTVTTSQSGCADGSGPQAIILGSDGNFYGTTSGGGLDFGTIFQITPAGVITTLHNFDLTDGEGSGASLIQDTNGVFYGTTYYGGNVASGPYGTIFRLSAGLGPFVKTVPTSGKVGTAVRILGTNLTGATSVFFNGVASTFKVVSPGEIVATVPTGATTGEVSVNVNATTLVSNVPFTID